MIRFAIGKRGLAAPISGRGDIMGYFTVPSAIPGFFLSSFVLMLLWGAIAPNFQIEKISYPMAMLITVTLWLAVAPLAAAAGRTARK